MWQRPTCPRSRALNARVRNALGGTASVGHQASPNSSCEGAPNTPEHSRTHSWPPPAAGSAALAGLQPPPTLTWDRGWPPCSGRWTRLVPALGPSGRWGPWAPGAVLHPPGPHPVPLASSSHCRCRHCLPRGCHPPADGSESGPARALWKALATPCQSRDVQPAAGLTRSSAFLTGD